jgi:hypothetical protein
MSKIRKAAINAHGFAETNKVAEQFDNLSEQELKDELLSINSMLCKYDSTSVFLYRVAINLYETVCERHKNLIKLT